MRIHGNSIPSRETREHIRELRAQILDVVKEARIKLYGDDRLNVAASKIAKDAGTASSTIRTIFKNKRLRSRKPIILQVLGALFMRYTDRREQLQKEMMQITDTLREIERLRMTVLHEPYITDYQRVPPVEQEQEQQAGSMAGWHDIRRGE